MIKIKDNPYISECESSTFSVLFNKFNNKPVNIIHALIKYPEWSADIDIFQYVKKIRDLRNNKKTYFLFDASTEGFSPFSTYFFDILYNNCRKYNISPKKIIIATSNFKDEENLKIYNKKHSIHKHSIKIFCFFSFKKMMLDMIEDHYGEDINAKKMLKKMKHKTNILYDKKPGLSLSRVNRAHRILAQYLLYQYNLAGQFVISQDAINKHEVEQVLHKYNVNKKNLYEWTTQLPIVADTTDFKTNHALFLNSELHSCTLFQIVNETHVDDQDRTSLFLSEKTFRSIAYMQPFLIYGQPGCNKLLEDNGFKLYHDLFDYSFDKIRDTKKRYLAILETIEHALEHLNNLNRDKQIEWKFSMEDTLKHNFSLLMDEDYDKKNFKKLIGEL